MPLRPASFLIFAALCASLIATASAAQEPSDDLRTGWLASRPASTSPPAGAGKSRKRKWPASVQSNLGVGYSVFERRADGATVRTDPRRTFASGERIRLLIEPGGTGFLYIFHVEGEGGTPSMLFPSARLNEGENVVFAHEPIEVPSRSEPDPLNQWFVFDDRPGTEHLYFVVTRTRLAGVPTGKALRAWSSKNGGAAAWQPSAEAWKRIVGGKNAAPRESLDELFGSPETDFERDAVVRGLGLPGTAPAPTVISQSGEKSARTFVTRVALSHR